MNGDKNGDKLFAANEDLQLNQWNELWVDLDKNIQGYTGGTVRGVHMHASPGAVIRFDGIYTCSRNWSTYYYHTDYLNSPRAMTDQSGAVVWRQDYLAFGADYSLSATGNTHKFTGHIKDNATGQYYAKARYFTTGLGRWSQPEPLLKGVPGKGLLTTPQLLNPYVYCNNNPLKYTDPDGKWIAPVLGAAIVGIGIDYAMQWRASGKSFSEYYKSGEYSTKRAAIIGGSSSVVAGAGALAGVAQGTLVAKALFVGSVGAATSISKQAALGENPSSKTAAISGATSAAGYCVTSGVSALANQVSPPTFITQQPIVNPNGGTAGFESVWNSTPTTSVLNEGIKAAGDVTGEVIQSVVEQTTENKKKEDNTGGGQ
ncbi:RHS domain-containing protein [candidate division TA06 bacterium]|nr:RHS domain-containing protein [candidate division TA06 bacterium]